MKTILITLLTLLPSTSPSSIHSTATSHSTKLLLQSTQATRRQKQSDDPTPTIPSTTLSIGTSPQFLNDITNLGTTKPNWNVAGDPNIAVDLPDYQSLLSLYVSSTTTEQIADIKITSGELLTTTSNPIEKKIIQTTTLGHIDIQMTCNGPGRSHVTIKIITTTQQSISLRYKKRCGILSRNGLAIGTSILSTSNVVNNGKVAKEYSSVTSPIATRIQSNGTYVTLATRLEQLNLGTSKGTQLFKPTLAEVIPKKSGSATILGRFQKETSITKELANDLHVAVLCTKNSVHDVIVVSVTMIPDPPYQVRICLILSFN